MYNFQNLKCRQLLTSDKISSLINEAVKKTIREIKLREHNKPFSPHLYLPQILLRILAELTFGHKYSFNDKQLKSLEHSFEMFNSELVKLILIDFLPVSKYFIRTSAQTKAEFRKLTALYENSLESYKNSYKTGDCDNFATSLLTAKIKMLEEKSYNSYYLNDNDLKGVLSAMFIGLLKYNINLICNLTQMRNIYLGGTDTSIHVINWLIILMSHYTEIQKKLRNEINDKIGKLSMDELRSKLH